MITIKPRGLWLLVKPVKNDSVSNKNGLIIPDQVEREQKAQGEIVSVGEKVKDLKKGQRVLYGRYAGEEIQVTNEEEKAKSIDYKLLLDEDILAVLE